MHLHSGWSNKMLYRSKSANQSNSTLLVKGADGDAGDVSLFSMQHTNVLKECLTAFARCFLNKHFDVGLSAKSFLGGMADGRNFKSCPLAPKERVRGTSRSMRTARESRKRGSEQGHGESGQPDTQPYFSSLVYNKESMTESQKEE